MPQATGWKGGGRFTIAKRIPSGAGPRGREQRRGRGAPRAEPGGRRPAGRRRPPVRGRLGRLGLRRSSSPAGPSSCGAGESALEALPKEAYRRIRGHARPSLQAGLRDPDPVVLRPAGGRGPAGLRGARRPRRGSAPGSRSRARPRTELLFNSMERPAFAKFPALPGAPGATCSGRFGIAARMSGSGSACYAFLHESVDTRPVEAAIREAWGPSAFVARDPDRLRGPGRPARDSTR